VKPEDLGHGRRTSFAISCLMS